MGLLDFLFGKPKKYESHVVPVSADGRALITHGRARTPEAAILDVKVGGVITYNATDFVVRNRHVYESHGFEWFSYQLVDTISGEKFWVDAEDDDELEVAICKTARLDLSLPLPEKIFFEGQSYYQDEHGYAKVLIESEDSEPRYTQVEYWDYYNDAEDKFIGVERWGGELEASAGHYIEPFELSILSAGGSHA